MEKREDSRVSRFSHFFALLLRSLIGRVEALKNLLFGFFRLLDFLSLACGTRGRTTGDVEATAT